MIIFTGFGIFYSIAKEGKGIVKFLNGPNPSVTNAFIDKEKYFSGDIMAITVETKDALGVKAFVENEIGFNEVIFVVMARFEGKETWSGKWKVENSLNGKKYKLKIIAFNKSGTAETVLEWEDPNPGHPWNQIDSFPPACGAGEFVRGLGSSLTCAAGGGSSECIGIPTICSTRSSMCFTSPPGDCSPADGVCPATYVLKYISTSNHITLIDVPSGGEYDCERVGVKITTCCK